ncbi:MAG: D-alanine--D-alanine ligase [Bacilli bacterium]|nr:D-alanine--D-alanine ligase [Bacilli bacterium]
MKIKVGVLFGGESVEHEVSIISAVTAMNKIDQEKYDIIPIYMTKDREWYTGEMLRDIETYKDMDLIKRYATNVVLYASHGKFILRKKHSLFNSTVTDIDVAFPITHGTNVEDGALQGYLQTIGIPYVGPNVYAAAVGQDKVYMKDIFECNKLPITKYTWFYDCDYKKDSDEIIKKIEDIKYPVIVKPATTGSSVGIGVASNREELISSIDDAIQYDSKILVEDVVENLREVNISVVGNHETQRVSEIEEVTSKNKFLSYNDKYIGDGTISHGAKKGVKAPVKGAKGVKGGGKAGAPAASRIPADLSKEMRKEIEDVAVRAFKALGSSGVVRIDFLIDSKAKKVYVNEINSIPGNLAFYLWEAKGVDFTELLNDVINIGIKDYKVRTSKTHSFESNILAGYTGGMKGMKGTKKLR